MSSRSFCVLWFLPFFDSAVLFGFMLFSPCLDVYGKFFARFATSISREILGPYKARKMGSHPHVCALHHRGRIDYGGVGPPPPGGDLEDPPPIAGRPRPLTGEVLVSVALKTDTVCHLPRLDGEGRLTGAHQMLPLGSITSSPRSCRSIIL